jgi:hypothetical protein
LGLENARLSLARMANRTFNIPKSKGKSFKTIDAIDVAAKYFVYKLYERTAVAVGDATGARRVTGDSRAGS